MGGDERFGERYSMFLPQTRDAAREGEVDKAVTGAARRLRNRNCREAILRLLRRAAEALFDDASTANINEYTQRVGDLPSTQDTFETGDPASHEPAILSEENLINNVWNADISTAYDDPRVNREDGDAYGFDRATTTTGANTPRIVFHGGFFREVERGQRLPIRSAAGLNYNYTLGSRRGDTDRELTVLHEAMHAVVHGFSDELLGRLILNRQTVTRAQGSAAINDFLNQNCR